MTRSLISGHATPCRSAPPQDPRALFGRRLARLRKERAWSQETLALESGLTRSYLGGVERGLRNIALLNSCRLAQTLEVEPGELFRFDRIA